MKFGVQATTVMINPSTKKNWNPSAEKRNISPSWNS